MKRERKKLTKTNRPSKSVGGFPLKTNEGAVLAHAGLFLLCGS